MTLSDCVVYCRGHEVIPLLPQCRSAACHREMYASLHVRFTTGWARGRPFESAGDGDLPAPGNVACRNSVSLSTWWHGGPRGALGRELLWVRGYAPGNGILAMSCRLCTAMSSATSLRSRRTNGQRSRQVHFSRSFIRHEHPTAGRALSDAL